MYDHSPKGVPAGGTVKSSKGSLIGAEPSGGPWGALADSALGVSVAGALDEDGSAAPAWAVSLSLGGGVLKGGASFATFFPLALSPTED